MEQSVPVTAAEVHEDKTLKPHHFTSSASIQDTLQNVRRVKSLTEQLLAVSLQKSSFLLKKNLLYRYSFRCGNNFEITKFKELTQVANNGFAFRYPPPLLLCIDR